MSRAQFAHVETWVFDLDNTLYPPEARLFDAIEARMTAYVMRALGVDAARANHMRQHYWRTYGTTLAGLMAEHRMDPDPYLAEVHDISLATLRPTRDSPAAIEALPGRKVVYTNGSREHARRVTRARGLEGAFDALYGFEDAGYMPKPRAEAFAAVFGRAALEPGAARCSRTTRATWPCRTSSACARCWSAPPRAAPHVHHPTQDLTDFLTALV